METQPEQVAARLAQLITQELGLNPAHFAREIGLNLQTVAASLAGKSKPGGATLQAIATRYPHLNLTWLLTGAGVAFPYGVHGERKPAAPQAPADAQEAYRRAAIAEAEKQMLESQVAEQQKLIKLLKGELGKSPGSLDQPRTGAPDSPDRPVVRGFVLSVNHRAGVTR